MTDNVEKNEEMKMNESNKGRKNDMKRMKK